MPPGSGTARSPGHPMRIELRSSDRRALLVGAAVLGPLLVGRVLVVPGIRHLADDRRAVATERDLLERERALLASAPAYSATAERLVASLAVHATRVFGPTDPPEPRLREIAVEGNVKLENIRRVLPVPDSQSVKDGSPMLVQPLLLHVAGESDLEGVLSFLGALREDEHLWSVELIDLGAQEPDGSRAPETVRMELRLRVLLSAEKTGGTAP